MIQFWFLDDNSDTFNCFDSSIKTQPFSKIFCSLKFCQKFPDNGVPTLSGHDNMLLHISIKPTNIYGATQARVSSLKQRWRFTIIQINLQFSNDLRTLQSMHYILLQTLYVSKKRRSRCTLTPQFIYFLNYGCELRMKCSLENAHDIVHRQALFQNLWFQVFGKFSC